MSNSEWARKLRVTRRMVVLMGGAKHLEGMTELGRRIYAAVWRRGTDVAGTQRAMRRIALAARESKRQARAADELRHRREYLLRRMRGETADLVWLGHPGLMAAPQRMGPRAEAVDWRAQGWAPAVVQAMERQERKAG